MLTSPAARRQSSQEREHCMANTVNIIKVIEASAAISGVPTKVADKRILRQIASMLQHLT
jgi:hypothetical protein